ncbi:hypothetical protein NOL29_05020 [Vibrio parahaemolyticus]|uniref:hypothetical protein n=1 Tax=Vibrio parahaemolyticus TaxID=670 RepID=UPI00226AE1EB|nr:hypothetical protein [Vibrio parahaemolyticus]MCX8800676.1 hypothetical protein [Vibrio parahaemolyticus]
MNVNAYSQFSELTPEQLLSVFKDEYRTIAKDNRTLSLNQGYQALAKHAQCNSLESMKSQSIILIKVSEFINALIACGLPVSETTNTARFERLLKCDVLCPPLSGGLCVAITNDGLVLETPYLSNPTPYIAGSEICHLQIDMVDGAWLSNEDWVSFVNNLEDNLDLDDDIQQQASEHWSEVHAEKNVLTLDPTPDYEEMATWSEGRFRQFVLKHSLYTHVDTVYNFFDEERKRQLA